MAWQQRTVAAARQDFPAVVRIVTDANSRPHVVHRPHHRFTTGQYLADPCQREKALVDPVQMDDIGLLELRKRRDVDSRVGNIHIEEVLTREAQRHKDAQALPEEMPLL